MNYKYIEDQNFEDLSCGRVIRHKAGYPNFPVRLAGEIFMTCLKIIDKENGGAVLYDPCCGGAYMLTVIGFLCGGYVAAIYASDISDEAVAAAKENLNLLTEQGLIKRKSQLEKMYNEFGKESHSAAIRSADSLIKIQRQTPPIDYTVFSADIMNENALRRQAFKADVVFTDVPYGELTAWSTDSAFAVNKLLTAIIPVLDDNSVVAVGSDKSQKISHFYYQRVRKIIVGKRKIELLQRKTDYKKSTI